MSETVSFKSLANSLPVSGSPAKILGTDAAGNPVRANVGNFANTVCFQIRAPQVLKIYASASLLVSCRGTNGGRCALVWISAYGEGTVVRNTVSILCGGPYRVYNNGKSDPGACVYLISVAAENNPDSINVVSLDGSVPKCEIVSAIPADAVLVG